MYMHICRFWHSSAAYAIASEVGCGDSTNLPPVGHEIYKWPQDLLEPDVSGKCLSLKLLTIHPIWYQFIVMFKIASDADSYELLHKTHTKCLVEKNRCLSFFHLLFDSYPTGCAVPYR